MLRGDETGGGEAGDGIVPVVVLHVEHMAPVHAAGHVDRDVQAAIARHGFIHRALDVGIDARIALQRKGFQAALAQEVDGVVGRRLAHVGNADPRAFAGEEVGNGAADVGARTKHNGDFVLESIHDAFFS
ncbi:hypothetical protein SDC9_190843 [bioreactor metagenome]|uniref:Uncharacterized protein n=1 Tax=bioreactor metagenome TaxID=1076179 RepID=A0A645I4D6_9ZZZZ